MRTSARQRKQNSSQDISRTVCRICCSPISSPSSYINEYHYHDSKDQYHNNVQTASSSSMKGIKYSWDLPHSSEVCSSSGRAKTPTCASRERLRGSESDRLRPMRCGPSSTGGGDCTRSPHPNRVRSSSRHRTRRANSPARSAPQGLPNGLRRGPGKRAAQNTDVGWRIPYPGQIFPTPPSALPAAGSQQHLRHSGAARSAWWASPRLRCVLLLATTALAVLVAALAVVHFLRPSRAVTVAPLSRQLPSPSPAPANAHSVALRDVASNGALQQMRAELRRVQRQLHRVKGQAVEAASAATAAAAAAETAALNSRRECRPTEETDVQEEGGPMADFALESAGGSVVATPGTLSYFTGAWETLWGMPLWPVEKSPRNIIQPSLEPGACWAFRGPEGRVVVALAMPARLTAVTLHHIPASAALTGSRDSAPRDFAVTGLETSHDTSGPLLGQFSYSLLGSSRQTFVFTSQYNTSFQAVLLHILNNHGNTEYTCVYRFQVHGHPVSGKTTKDQHMM